MQQGWIKIFRSITDDEDYFAERFTREMAWIDLLLLANFKDSTIIKRGVKIQLHRGQIFKSIRFLSDRWQWNERTTMKFLDSLELEGKIQRKITNVNTLITITNYSNYLNRRLLLWNFRFSTHIFFLIIVKILAFY